MSEKTIFVVQNNCFLANSESTLKNRPMGYFECPNFAKSLKENYKILADPIGSFCHLTQQKQIKGPPFQLDTFSLAYLIKNHQQELTFECLESFPLDDIINEDSFLVFETLIKKGYFLISAKKFGAKFLAYDCDPTKGHAKYLVFLSEEQNQGSSEVSNNNTESLIYINRLCTIAKKEAILAKLMPFSQSLCEQGETEHSNMSYLRTVQFTKMQRLQHY